MGSAKFPDGGETGGGSQPSNNPKYFRKFIKNFLILVALILFFKFVSRL